MGLINNLSQSDFNDIFRRLRKLENGSPMNNAAIGRGGIEVYDQGTVNISDGNLIVNGTATISGVLNADGTVTLSGTVGISGPLTISGNTSITGNVTSTGTFTNNGPTNLNGATKTTGTLSVEGLTTLKNDLNVTTGKINAGAVTIDPAYLSGSVKFSNGTYVAATPNGAQLVKPGGGAVTVSDGQADMGVVGGGNAIAAATSASLNFGTKYVQATSAGVKVNGVLTLAGYPSTTAVANMHMTAGGVVYVSTSAARFKVDAQPMDLPDSLLAVPVKDWWDKGEHDSGEAMRRVPGVIAEEVEAAGGESFVTYDEDGTIQGVAYDRYALARTEVLARKLDAALTRIDKLESDMRFRSIAR